MRVKEHDNGDLTITFRQSWLSTAADCLEQARREAFEDPESGLWRYKQTDAAALGTAMHSGYETGLAIARDERVQVPVDLVIDVALEAWDEIAPTVTDWVQMSDVGARAFIPNLARGWHKHILPLVNITPNLKLEHTFDLPFFDYTLPDGRRVFVRLTGTIDCIDGGLWDWKTSGQPYKQWEKQRWAVQPTVYWWAARQEGLVPHYANFRYGVMVKNKSNVQAEVVEVKRTDAHVMWLREQIAAIIALYLSSATQWPMNDAHTLCSPKWCAAWDTCKGAHMTEAVLTWKPRR